MTEPLHSLSPQELADHGIPVEVALRARIEHAESLRETALRSGHVRLAASDRSRAEAYRDALAIIEAKR